LLGAFLEYFNWNLLPRRLATASAVSNISLVCDADKQKRTRDSIKGVAGKPAPTAATPNSMAALTKALQHSKNTSQCEHVDDQVK